MKKYILLIFTVFLLLPYDLFSQIRVQARTSVVLRRPAPVYRVASYHYIEPRKVWGGLLIAGGGLLIGGSILYYDYNMINSGRCSPCGYGYTKYEIERNTIIGLSVGGAALITGIVLVAVREVNGRTRVIRTRTKHGRLWWDGY